MLCPLEHHLGEQIGQAKPVVWLIANARVKLHSEGDGGQAWHPLPDHPQTIRKDMHEIVRGQFAAVARRAGRL